MSEQASAHLAEARRKLDEQDEARRASLPSTLPPPDVSPYARGFGNLLSRRLAGQRAQAHAVQDAATPEEEAPAPAAPEDDPAVQVHSRATAWLGERLASERAEVASLLERVTAARTEASDARTTHLAAQTTYARASTPAGWKAVTSARDIADQAKVRLQGLAIDHAAAARRLDASERQELARVRAELLLRASGAALPIDGLAKDLGRILRDLELLAAAMSDLVTERNLASRGTVEITAYLGDREAFLKAPVPVDVARGWATQAGCDRSSSANARHVLGAVLRKLGHGARGAHASPLRNLIRALDHAHEPAPPAPPVVDEAAEIVEVCS